MNYRNLAIIGVLILLSAVLTACGVASVVPNTSASNNPAGDDAQELTAPVVELDNDQPPADINPEITPSVSVSDQDVSSGILIIKEVVATHPGWIVIHAEANGSPGTVIGIAQVREGTNSNVSVEIDLDAATETLFAMLHIDAATPGKYEFPGEDIPVQINDNVVVTPFAVTLPQPTISTSVTVIVEDGTFDQKEITIKAGTTVSWVVEANFSHTVTADDGFFDSGGMKNGETFSFTFDQVGEFPYHCRIHGGAGGAGMSGIVKVTE